MAEPPQRLRLQRLPGFSRLTYSPTDQPHACVHHHGEEMRGCVGFGEVALHLHSGGRLEADGYWVTQPRPTDRSAPFPGIILCRRRSRRARAAVSDFVCGVAATTSSPL